MILDLLNGVAIEFSFLLSGVTFVTGVSVPASLMPRGTIAVLPGERKRNV